MWPSSFQRPDSPPRPRRWGLPGQQESPGFPQPTTASPSFQPRRLVKVAETGSRTRGLWTPVGSVGCTPPVSVSGSVRRNRRRRILVTTIRSTRRSTAGICCFRWAVGGIRGSRRSSTATSGPSAGIQVKTRLGSKKPPGYRKSKRSPTRWGVLVEKPDLTRFKVRFGKLTLKIYAQGERACASKPSGKAPERCLATDPGLLVPTMVALRRGRVGRFLNALPARDVCFIADSTREQRPLPSPVGKRRNQLPPASQVREAGGLVSGAASEAVAQVARL